MCLCMRVILIVGLCFFVRSPGAWFDRWTGPSAVQRSGHSSDLPVCFIYPLKVRARLSHQQPDTHRPARPQGGTWSIGESCMFLHWVLGRGCHLIKFLNFRTLALELGSPNPRVLVFILATISDTKPLGFQPCPTKCPQAKRVTATSPLDNQH